MKTSSIFSVIVPALISSFILFGCAKDQTLDEYHQSQVNEELTRLQAVSGVYTGTIVNSATQASLGNLTIDLEPSTASVNNSDNTGIAAQAQLLGQVNISSPTVEAESKISTGGFFSSDNSSTGSYNGVMSITLSNGTVAQMSIAGSISNGNFTGQITSTTDSAITGNFTVARNTKITSGQVTSRPPVSSQDVRTYVGSMTSKNPFTGVGGSTPTAPTNSSIGVTMVLRVLASTTQETFYDIFARNVSATVSLNFQLPNSTVQVDGVSFTGVQLDLLNGSFHAVGNYSGDITTQTSLDCNQTSVTGLAGSWNCSYMSAKNGVSESFNVSPQN